MVEATEKAVEATEKAVEETEKAAAEVLVAVEATEKATEKAAAEVLVAVVLEEEVMGGSDKDTLFETQLCNFEMIRNVAYLLEQTRVLR